MHTPRTSSITVPHRTERRPWLGWFCAAALLCPHTGYAQNIRLDVPPQSLGTALDSVAREAGLQILYPPEAVEGLTTRGVQGEYTPQEAIKRLLDGTGLRYEFLKDNTVTVSDAEKAKREEDVTLPEMIVTAKPTDATSYSVPNASTATKTDTPIMETPVSVQVVPRAVIDDQKAAMIKDALENVSSVRPQPSIGVFNGFIIRGFSDFNQYRNGLRVSFTDFDTANLERLQVLKGPAAMLYGRVEPGGLVNLVTKQPQDIPYYSLEQQFGSYDFYRTLWDATGPMTANGALQYRFTGAYQNSGSFREFHETEQFQIHTGLAWRVGDATEIAVDVEGFNRDFQSDQGLPAIGNRPAPIPISRSLQDPNGPLDNLYKVNVGFNLTHRFNDDGTLRNRFLAQTNHWDLFDTVVAFFDASALRPDNRTLDRTLFFQVGDIETYATNLDLTGEFQVGGTKPETLFGFDYLRLIEEFNSFGYFATADPTLAIDIFNPTTRINPARFNRDLVRQGGTGSGSFQRRKDEWFGIYFQDQITLWDKFHILGGGRYDWASTGRGRSRNSFAEADARRQQRRDQEFSPRVGILYQPWSRLGVYGNWSQSFGANNGISATGEAFPPQAGEQYEAGFKTQLFDERLTATLAYYHLTKSNILTSDLSTPDPFDRIAIGEARSQGIEFDLSGQLNDYFSLIGNYAYTDAKFTKDNRRLVRPTRARGWITQRGIEGRSFLRSAPRTSRDQSGDFACRGVRS